MPDAPITLTNANLDSVLNGDKPVLILFTSGEGLRSDFKTAFDKAAKDDAARKITYVRADPKALPELAQKFGVGEKPVLVAWYCGEEVARRQKPWGTDLPLAIELLNKAVSENGNPISDSTPRAATPEPPKKEAKPVTEPTVVLNKPVTVTDATFEQEVLNADLPVLVDFWAAWCGPCRMVGPILEKLAGEFAGQIKIAKVDVDANPGLSQAFRIQSIPNLMIVKQRTMIFNQPGALPEVALRDLIQQAIALEIPPQAAQQTAQQPQAEAEAEDQTQQ
ncbi:MAG TPA: thioredoxin [Phototrophicaceae bacterium]|nr:thioredoxin [Phototrophicaceae bacterium]